MRISNVIPRAILEEVRKHGPDLRREETRTTTTTLGKYSAVSSSLPAYDDLENSVIDENTPVFRERGQDMCENSFHQYHAGSRLHSGSRTLQRQSSSLNPEIGDETRENSTCDMPNYSIIQSANFNLDLSNRRMYSSTSSYNTGKHASVGSSMTNRSVGMFEPFSRNMSNSIIEEDENSTNDLKIKRYSSVGNRNKSNRRKSSGFFSVNRTRSNSR